MSEGRRPERLSGTGARGRDLLKASLLGLLLMFAAAPALAVDAGVRSASIAPKHGFTDSVGGVRIKFRIGGSAPADVRIRIAGVRGAVRTIDVPQAEPGEDLVERWDGLTNGGRPVADGRYNAMVATAGGNRQEAGSVQLHRHFFPVRGRHGTRGPVGDFRAQRDGGRVHKGFDVAARCGTPLAAVTTGT